MGTLLKGSWVRPVLLAGPSLPPAHQGTPAGDLGAAVGDPGSDSLSPFPSPIPLLLYCQDRGAR